MLLRLFLACLVPVALGCSCAETGPACDAVGTEHAIFVARVIGDGSPARVVIEEVLQNVPEGLGEVDVETRAGTNCRVSMRVAERWVAISKGQRYAADQCSRSFRLEGNTVLLDALRTQVRGGAPQIVGRAEPGATVLADRGDGGHQQAVADGDGWFVFAGLPAGQYRLRARKAGFVGDALPRIVELGAQGCRMAHLWLQPDGRIAGMVRGREGDKPVAGVKVYAHLIDEIGLQVGRPQLVAETDAEGRFALRPLGPGVYEIGVNAHKFFDEDAYPRTIYGEYVRLEKSGSVAGVNLRVPGPRRAREIRVRVTRANGDPAPGVAVRLEHAAEWRQTASGVSGADGVVVLRGYVGERYRLFPEGEVPVLVERDTTELTVRVGGNE